MVFDDLIICGKGEIEHHGILKQVLTVLVRTMLHLIPTSSSSGCPK